MTKVQIIEDDARMAQDIQEILFKSFPDLHLLPVATTAEEAEEALGSHPPDLLITDINLGDREVFSVLEKVSTGAYPIIFITAFSKHAVRAFKFSALQFLEKPFSDQELIEAVHEALDKIQKDDYHQMLQTFFQNYRSKERFDRLVLKNVEAVHVIPVKAIEYLKSDNNYTEVHIDDGRKIVVAKPLKHYEKQLLQQGFFRTHQSYLVNLTQAQTFHKKDSTLELQSGAQVAVSGSRSSALIEQLSRNL